jgi:hypothetical protein
VPYSNCFPDDLPQKQKTHRAVWRVGRRDSEIRF